MKPSDFVTTFERQFTVPGPTSFYAGIVGADKCKATSCDLSQGVVADDNAYTLTIHLTASDPEFLDKLALPFAYVVPGNTSPKNLKQRRAAGHRPVHVAVVRPQQGSGARPQPELQGVEPGRAA